MNQPTEQTGSGFADVRKSAWDTETTGPNPLEDRIVTAAFIVRTPGEEDPGRARAMPTLAATPTTRPASR